MMKWSKLALSCTAAMLLNGCYVVKYRDYADFKRKEYADLVQFEGWLTQQGLLGVVPTEGLVRSATDWRECHAQPWEVPPAAYWPALEPTLRLLKQKIIPLVGPLQVESGWRAPEINSCVGGAAGSRHIAYQALDLSPMTPISRQELLDRLCIFWADHGREWNMGLGTYGDRRIHIDTGGWRTWGQDYSAKTSACVRDDEEVLPSRSSIRYVPVPPAEGQ